MNTQAITAETPVDYANATIREHAQHLVSREVYYCISSLVSSLTSSPDACAALDVDFDDVMSVCAQDDWETPAREYIDGLDASDLKQTAEYLGVEGADEWDDDTEDTEALAAREAAIIAHCEADQDQWRELCDFNRLNPDTAEAYEHWLVSNWLASKLEDLGEMVSRDLLGLTVWGRCTTGQSISVDHVLLTIARDNLTRD